ncbi:hypothetical protein M409DRAFT_58506 [Zasmidium cellare ATCC 36951]|uniref:Uncharacterized protein n=1 Tax=Zasmidium cellare ATCC 36951 TaxID=1080233 RepID=A0A6A6C8T5_ZASCE|nr:uncharacterized protein M409DRAFT_58506 [Zasmidium cellare ATCC 36951]KAF2162049.1 hypothetical protein M409DRAFT_58506 [Zasmidium cellare ATCC 36951]
MDITGGTGYIGGSVLDTLVKRHPEYEISALLRTVPEDFETLCPQVKVIKGTYDDHDILHKAAGEADVVVHTGNSDHIPSMKSLIAGLAATSQPSAPKYLIHLSGTGIVADFLDPTYLGRENPKTWSDISDLEAITSLPETAMHRPVDKLIQDASRAYGDRLKTAIVCPADIYGEGKGPGRKASVYFPNFVQQVKNLGVAPFYAENGGNAHGWVHLDDLMELYVKLVEAAVSSGRTADWGVEGYYFVTAAVHTQLEIATSTAKVLHKHNLIAGSEPQQVPLGTIKTTLAAPGRPHRGTYFFASNARTRAERATKALGWKSQAPDLMDVLEEEVLTAWKNMQ